MSHYLIVSCQWALTLTCGHYFSRSFVLVIQGLRVRILREDEVFNVYGLMALPKNDLKFVTIY